MNFTKFAEWSFGKRSNTPSRHSVFPNHKCRVIYPEFPSKSELHSAFLCTGLSMHITNFNELKGKFRTIHVDKEIEKKEEI